LFNWKFGIDYAALSVSTQAFRALLVGLGFPGILAIHVAWKLPLVAADLLTAGAIYRLALNFAPGRAAALASLWLVNPTVLWVSAGHGQIESVAILCVFAALQLALDGRLVAAGLVTGLGVGIEYFPLAVVGVILIWWRGGYLTGRLPLTAYAAGLMSSVLLCFAPLLFDPVVRQSVIGGVASGGGLSGNQGQSVLAVWVWLGYRWADTWPVLFGISGVLCLGLSVFLAKRSRSVGLQFLAVILILAVLLDVNALPQFAVIAASGLWLLAIVLPVQPIILLAVPGAGMATAFLFLDRSSTANAYFFDDFVGGGIKLWPVPYSEQAAAYLGHIFCLGLIGTTIYVAARISKPSRLSWTAAGAVGASVCLLLVAWSSQPAVWGAVLRSAPSANLPDFEYFIATKHGSLAQPQTSLWQVNYPEGLIAASREAGTKPLSGLQFSMADLYQSVATGASFNGQTWRNSAVSIPAWDSLRSSIQYLWIQLLVASTYASEASAPEVSRLRLQVNGGSVTPDSMGVVTDGWAVVNFRLPAALVGSNGRLQFTPSPSPLRWAGSADGPWVRILPASGTMHALVDFDTTTVSYQLNPQGDGYVVGLPLSSSFAVSLDRSNLPAPFVQGAVLRWPPAREPWKSNRWIQGFGGIFGLAVFLATVWLMRFYLRPIYPYPAVINPTTIHHNASRRSASSFARAWLLARSPIAKR
jgi:hypothetical protein